MARKSGGRSRRTLSMSSKFAIATATAKKQGYSNFSKGSSGYKARKHIAEGIARRYKIRKRSGR